MAKPPTEALSANREVIVVLRLLIGPDGNVVHGHIVDPGQREAGPFRFQSLGRALRDWIGTEPATAELGVEPDGQRPAMTTESTVTDTGDISA